MKPSATLIALVLSVVVHPSPEASAGVRDAMPSVRLNAPADGTWRADFETGDLSQWRVVIREEDSRIRVVRRASSPGNRYAVRLTTDDSDIPADPNPRSQLDGPIMHREGDDHYIEWQVFFPSDFPTPPPTPAPPGQGNPWLVFFEWHGRPWGQTPAPGIFDVRSDAQGRTTVGFGRDERYRDRPWSRPLTRGQWLHFRARVLFSRDPLRGRFQLWYNGQPQRFADGTFVLRQATILPNQRHGLYSILTNYRARGRIQSPVSILFDQVAVSRVAA